MSSPPALDQYRELLRRLDEKFAEIHARYPGEFACRLGCHSCCKPGLTVGALEAQALGLWFDAHPEAAEAAKRLEQANPHSGKRCALLDEHGACVAYEARPLVCRSHGAPLQYKDPSGRGKDDEQVRLRDVCPLNFRSTELASLPPDAVLNLDTLNTLLALLTRLAHPGIEARTALRIGSILR